MPPLLLCWFFFSRLNRPKTFSSNKIFGLKKKRKQKNHRNEMETEWCEQKSCNCWKRTSQQKGMFHQKSVVMMVMLPLEILYQMITSQFIITKRLTMWFFSRIIPSHRLENSSSEICISFSVFRILIKKIFCVFCWHRIFGFFLFVDIIFSVEVTSACML